MTDPFLAEKQRVVKTDFANLRTLVERSTTAEERSAAVMRIGQLESRVQSLIAELEQRFATAFFESRCATTTPTTTTTATTSTAPAPPHTSST